jgi:ATP/maltotriose-dependent transcriptional regulator MalT
VILEDLSSRVAAHDRPVVLFLDDLRLINDPDAARTLEWLLRHAGTHLRFVVGSREALGWPQAELRLRGQRVEQTAGWPAAMELLTLALNDAPDAGRLIADFATSERGVRGYLRRHDPREAAAITPLQPTADSM